MHQNLEKFSAQHIILCSAPDRDKAYADALKQFRHYITFCKLLAKELIDFNENNAQLEADFEMYFMIRAKAVLIAMEKSLELYENKFKNNTLWRN